jgi:LSD1 subclass zinc finger protein
LGTIEEEREMSLITFQCKHCGTPLEVQPGQEFVKCPSCKGSHQVEMGAGGQLHVTKLEKKLDDIKADTTKIAGTTDGLAAMQRKMADRANAQSAYDETKERYAQFCAFMNQYMPRARASKGKAVKLVVLGVLGLIVGILVASSVRGAGGAGAIIIVIGLFFGAIGIAWASSVGGKIKKHMQTNAEFQATMAQYLSQARQRIEI